MKSVVLFALCILFALPVFPENLRQGALACRSEHSLRRAWPMFIAGETGAISRLIQRNECGYAESSATVATLRTAGANDSHVEIKAPSWRGTLWTQRDFLAPDGDTTPTRIMSFDTRLAFDEMATMTAYLKSAVDGGVAAMNRFREEAIADGRMIQLPARAYVVTATSEVNERMKLGGIFVTSGPWEDLQTERGKSGRNYFVGLSAEQFNLLPREPMRMDGQKKSEEPVHQMPEREPGER